MHLYAKNKEDIDVTYRALKKDTTDFNVYLPIEVPARYHYAAADDRYRRIGDILLVSRYPKVFNLRNQRIIPGMHGFDNAMPEMHATFYAWGPAFKEHQKIPSFENVNVYPMIAKILGLNIDTPIDGKAEVLNPVLK